MYRKHLANSCLTYNFFAYRRIIQKSFNNSFLNELCFLWFSKRLKIVSWKVCYLLVFQDHDGDLFSFSGFDETFIVTVSGLVRDPAGLLRVVGLRLQLDLQLVGDDQPWGRVWVRSLDFLDVSGHVEILRKVWDLKNKSME